MATAQVGSRPRVHSRPVWLALGLCLSSVGAFAREPATPAPKAPSVASPTASPADVERAKEWFKAGAAAYAVGEYMAAIQALDAAYAITPVPAIAFSLAQAERRQYFVNRRSEHIARAVSLFRRYVEQAPSGSRRIDAIEALSQLEPLAAKLERERERERESAEVRETTPQASEPVGLDVEASGLDVDEASVRTAITRELERSESAGVTPPVRVAVRVVSGGELTVTLHTTSRDMSRTVAAPTRADEVPELAALLVGNLARNEASDLLSQLHAAGAKSVASEGPDVSAGSIPTEPGLEPKRELPLDFVNLSLFHPLTLLRSTEERRLALEVGLFYSRVGALSGVALTYSGVSRIDGAASGLVLAGIGYFNRGPGEGVRIGGIFGVGHESFVGVGLAAAANLHFGDYFGAEFAAGVNVATGKMEGGQVGAGFNLAGELSGLQAVAGLNLAKGPVQGMQVAGGLNVATGAVEGAQVAGALNYAERVQGLQLSIINIGGDVDGLQLGIVNVARDVAGAQVGIVNVARKVDGVSFGIVPYSQQGRTQGVAWYNSNQPFNVGVRFQSGALYVMPTFGYSPDGDSAIGQAGEASFWPGVSLGFRLPIERAFADLDVNYSNRSNGTAYDEHNVAMRYRLLAGWQFTPAFAAFVGGGVRHTFRTNGTEDQSVEPELSLGVQLL